MKALRLMLAIAGLCAMGWTPAHAQDIQDRTIKFGHLNNTDHPVSMGVKRFAELVAAKSGGKMKVQEFPSSTLGNEMQQQSALQGGVQEMSAPATTSLAGIVKEFGLIDFPFSVSTYAQADALLDGPLGQALIAKLPEKGLMALGYWDLGFRNVTNSRRPITKPEDLEGLKLRVIPNPVFLETFKALKANPVPMPFTELYGALESKAVDGQENPFAVILSNKFFEVQKYRQRDQPRLRDEHSPREQALLGQAFTGRAKDHAGRRRRDTRLSTPGQSSRGPEGRYGVAGEGDAVQRGGSGRTSAHGADRKAGHRQVCSQLRPGHRQDLQRRAGPRPSLSIAESRPNGPSSGLL